MANSVLPEKIDRMGLFILNHHNLPAVANSVPTFDLKREKHGRKVISMSVDGHFLS